jgi:hypothetical protein
MHGGMNYYIPGSFCVENRRGQGQGQGRPQVRLVHYQSRMDDGLLCHLKVTVLCIRFPSPMGSSSRFVCALDD